MAHRRDSGIATKETGQNIMDIQIPITTTSVPGAHCAYCAFGKTYEAAPKVIGLNPNTPRACISARTTTTGITIWVSSEVTGGLPDGTLTVDAVVKGDLA
jgi:hypothetical protein